MKTTTMILNKSNLLYLFLEINYDKHSCKVLTVLEDTTLVEDILPVEMLANHFNKFLKRKKTYVVAYISNLKKFVHTYENIINNTFLGHDILKNNNMYYKLELKFGNNLKYKVIVKDYNHFVVKANEENDIYSNINILNTFADLLKQNFDMDLHKKTILTISGLGKRLFEKISPEQAKKIYKINKTEDSFIRKGYIGGRCEIYRGYNKGRSYHYDVNSLFPYIMSNKSLPIGKPTFINVDEVNLNKFYGFIEALVLVPESYLPILPFKDYSGNNLGIIYANGLIKGTFFSEELKLAVENGVEVKKVFKALTYNHAILFEKYVDIIYSLRLKQTNPILKKMFKDLLNGIYGKYAFHYENNSFDEIRGTEVIKHTFANVAISAAITSYARCHMYKIMSKYINHLLYMDTDAIILTVPLDSDLVNQNTLGLFKLEAEIKEFIALATKFYMYININNQPKFVFRGITIHKHIMVSVFLIKYFKHLLITNAIKSEKTINAIIPLQLKTSNKIVDYSFPFTNKRKYYKVNNKIHTIPWNIKLKSISES